MLKLEIDTRQVLRPLNASSGLGIEDNMILVMFVPFELHTKFGLMDAEPVKSSKHE